LLLPDQLLCRGAKRKKDKRTTGHCHGRASIIAVERQ
jgi:hypothetical protein